MQNFEMVAKTLQGLEEILAEELRSLGAQNVMPGKRMVAFEGDLRMLYKANLCCRTALRILKPFYKFTASSTDELYDKCKKFDWGSLLSPSQSFCIDTVAYSGEFTHSQFVTFRVKDAIVDWFTDRYGDGVRPRVCLEGANITINVHISDDDVTISLDSSGESLHRRGYRVSQTEAPINEVLAAGIILMSGWRGETPFVDPMCGSGTFLIEAALIAANIYPGIFRKKFAFEEWPDFDRDLFEEIYNDDSAEREVTVPIVGADVARYAIAATTANAKSAGVMKYLTLHCRSIADWEEAPAPAGVLVTNPPYGRRISATGMTLDDLYKTLGDKLKSIFTGYHAWIIGYSDDAFHQIHLAPSLKVPLLNGSLACELREYILFQGRRDDYVQENGSLSRFAEHNKDRDNKDRKPRRFDDRDGERKPRRDGDRKPRRFGDRDSDRKPRRFGDRDSERKPRRFDDRDGERKPRRFDDRDSKPRSPRYEDPEEEKLFKRRNLAFLDGIRGTEAKLQHEKGTFMRERSTFKRKKGGSDANPEE